MKIVIIFVLISFVMVFLTIAISWKIENARSRKIISDFYQRKADRIVASMVKPKMPKITNVLIINSFRKIRKFKKK